MTMLADRVDAVIGVDTHTDTHTAAICDARGAVLAEITVGTDEEGFGQLLDAALKHAPGERLAWALEGTGSYGAGLAKALREIDQEVIEAPTAKRPRGQGKNDTNDAVAIARTCLAQTRHAQPRHGQVREALRLITMSRNGDVKTRTRLINMFKAIVLTAPTPVRERLKGVPTARQVNDVAPRLRHPKDSDLRTRTSVATLQTIAAKIRALTTPSPPPTESSTTSPTPTPSPYATNSASAPSAPPRS